MSNAKITIWDTTVGYIAWDAKNNVAVFESDDEYRDAPFNISPYLHPDKSVRLYGDAFHENFRGLIPTFNDSLPDSFGNIVFKEWLEQQEIDQSDLNPVERLRYVGQRGIGALEYHEGMDIPNLEHNIDLEQLADVSDKIIKRKYEHEDYVYNPQALQNILTIGSPVGGAQAKILVAITDDNKLLAGDVMHDRPLDYFVVKLEHDPQNLWYREKNYVELVYNEIARDAGVNVAASHLIFEGGRAHFASKRFDRIDNRKVHVQTVNAFSGFYGKNHEFSYSDIFRIIEFLGLDYPNSEQLFKQMVFNVVASNRDDHTKNISFTMSNEGNWSLSPAYDLTYPLDPYQSFAIQHKIAINGKTRIIERADLVAVAEHAGIRNYNPIIDRVVEQVATFESRIKEYDLSKRTVELITKDLAEKRALIQS